MKKLNKCKKCNKKLLHSKNKCHNCLYFFHKSCESNLLPNSDYVCTSCLNKNLPFHSLENLEFFDLFNKKVRLENCPSFNIQSLLDEMSKNNEDNSFISDTLKSAYYD